MFLKNSLLKFIFISSLIQEYVCNICRFHHLKTDCRYRVDGISMIHIQAEINQCNTPVDVTFSLKCNDPHFKLDWSYTFTEIEERVDIPGFDVEVDLHVKHGFREGNKYTIEADFIVENELQGSRTTRFISDELTLVPDGNCVALTTDSIIAISVLVPLFMLAAIALVTVLVMWRRSVQHAKLRSQNLMNNGEIPGRSTPPVVFQNGNVSFDGISGTLDTEMQPDFSNLPGYEENIRY